VQALGALAGLLIVIVLVATGSPVADEVDNAEQHYQEHGKDDQIDELKHIDCAIMQDNLVTPIRRRIWQ
jgi:hypothetical protein